MDPQDADFSQRLIEAVEEATVASIFFFRVGHCLVLDLRPDDDSDCIVSVDPIMDSPYERLMSFRELRPTLSIPDELTIAPWAERVGDFEALGVLDAVIRRCGAAGGEELAAQAVDCYLELESLERKALADMLRGVGMTTIWQRDSSSETP